MSDAPFNDPTYYKAWLSLTSNGDLAPVAEYVATLRPVLRDLAARNHGRMNEEDEKTLAELRVFLEALDRALSGEGPVRIELVGRQGNPTSETERHAAVAIVQKAMRQSPKKEAAIQHAMQVTGRSRSTINEWLKKHKSDWRLPDLDD